MAVNINLRNAAVLCENPDVAMLAEGDHLHAVDPSVAQLKKDQCSPSKVLPLMQKAHSELVKFAHGTIDPQILEAVSLKPNEMDQIKEKIRNIYAHFPKHIKNQLCSMIH